MQIKSWKDRQNHNNSKTRSIIIWSCCLLFILNGCKDKNKDLSDKKEGDKEMSQMNFPELISRATEIMEMGADLQGLHGIEEFEWIRNNPKIYAKEAFEYLTDSKKESKYKYTAILSMQTLPNEDLLSFYRKLYQSFQSGNISETELDDYIFIPVDFGRFFLDNYNEKEVNKFLNELASDPKITQTNRDRYERLQSGQVTKDMIEFEKAQRKLDEKFEQETKKGKEK